MRLHEGLECKYHHEIKEYHCGRLQGLTKKEALAIAQKEGITYAIPDLLDFIPIICWLCFILSTSIGACSVLESLLTVSVGRSISLRPPRPFLEIRNPTPPQNRFNGPNSLSRGHNINSTTLPERSELSYS